MPGDNKRAIGAKYERLAGDYLEKKGYCILEYNYRCRSGEIDVIAKDGEEIVFCEVKYRKDASRGLPEEAVGPRKQKVLSKCGLYYMTSHGLLNQSCRFDVIGILGDQMRHIEHAFEYMR